MSNNFQKTINSKIQLQGVGLHNGIKVNQVKYGNGIRQENNLLKSSESRIIHMRPHANNSKDIDKPYFEYSQNKIKKHS